MIIKEFSISVPWGSLAGKTWGSPQNFPFLVLHGRQDNCGAFDRLLPLLPKKFFYVCIDHPGHGKSSPLAPGLTLSFFHYVFTARKVIDHFQWSQLSLLGHSFGGQISLFLAAFYPDLIKKLIVIDSVGSDSINSCEELVQHYRNTMESFLKQEKSLSSKKAPSYSLEQAIEKVMKNRWFSSLTKESADVLIKRSLVPNFDGFSFSTDQRFKIPMNPVLSSSQQIQIFKKIQCPILLILADESVKLYFSKEKSARALYNHFTSATSNVTFSIVEGNHDVHLNYPERVSPHITAFICNEKSKL